MIGRKEKRTPQATTTVTEVGGGLLGRAEQRLKEGFLDKDI